MERAIQVAKAAALAGGRVLAERAGRLGEVRTKSSSSDYVTDVDVASGVAIAREIDAAWPGARFVIEEAEVYEQAGVEAGSLSDPEVWVVDPLDGTTSYMHGYPCYSVSIALVREGRSVAGAVYDAARGEMFSAEAGGGATSDGRALACSHARTIEEALLITGFPYDRTVTLDRQLEIFGRALRRVHGIRRDGSAAIDCCQVAAGRADGFWELALKPWDLAAGALIIQEAGAVITGFDGRPWDVATQDIVAAGPELHPAMLEMVNAGT